MLQNHCLRLLSFGISKCRCLSISQCGRKFFYINGLRQLYGRPFIMRSASTIKSNYDNIELPQSAFVPYVMEKFDQYGDNVALVNGETGSTFTFTQIKKNVRSIGSYLARMGFKKGEVFCLYLKNCPEFPLTLYGITSIGGIATTANPDYTAGELLHQLIDSGASYILTAKSLLGTAKTAANKYGKIKSIFIVDGEVEGCHSFHELLSDDGNYFPENVDIDIYNDTAILPYSSGTTGLPKGVILTHANCVQNMAQYSGHEDLLEIQHKHDISLGVLPFFHIYGMIPVVTNTIRMGGKVITLSTFEPAIYLDLIQKNKVTILNIVPPIALFLAKHSMVPEYDLSSVEDIICAAAPLSQEMETNLRERIGHSVVRQGYGLTETGPVTHIRAKRKSVRGSCGTLVPNTEAKIIDPENGEIVKTGDDGEICIRGPQIMKGYLNNPEATANTIDSDGFLRTGDIGHIDENGYFFIVDRVKELIKYKGFQVAPAELEGILLSHECITDAAVIGKEDERAGELPTAYIVKTIDSVLTEEDVDNFISSQVSDFKRLRGGIFFVDNIPKSTSGKILRRILREDLNKV